MPEVQVRKRLIAVEEIFHEGGPVSRVPLRRASCLVVIRNPFAGTHVEEIAGLASPKSDEQEMEALIEKRKHEAEGPQINKARDNIVAGQDEVDDLLSSLGF